MHELKHYKFKISELDVSFEDVAKYAHFPDSMPSLNTFLKKELFLLNQVATIQGAYLISKAEVQKEHLKVSDKLFFLGNKLIKFYKNISSAAVFVCTAGKEITDKTMEFNQKGDFLEGYLLDVLGSVLVEKAMNKIHEYLRNDMEQKGLGITNRYSPGYCDWNIKEQKQLLDFFPENFCNISLNESCLMMPTKSVSGIIGIGRDVKYQKHLCSLCDNKNCIYRNIRKLT